MLYRYEKVPLARHLGELLTISVLGGACFGLPTTMVSERERGVWRRFRLAPVATGALVTSTVAARYLILLTAGLLQLLLALAIGMPWPGHPVQLWIAFTFVSFAFLGLGLVIATLADNVPAVQALGQCIFLPMLIIGGVAVPLASLPVWAQHLSAFFPGRYAVDALQSSVTGGGLTAAGFSLLALLLIGAAGCLAGAKMFRWDAEQRFAARRGKGWLAVALAAWMIVGLLAETRSSFQIVARTPQGPERRVPIDTARVEIPIAPAASVPASVPRPAPSNAPAAPATNTPPPATSRPAPAPSTSAETPPSPHAGTASPPPGAAELPAGPSSWKAVTMADIDRDLIFTRLPPDEGVVTPIAADDEQPDQQTADDLQLLREELPKWKPGKVDDPVQRTRNILYVAAVPDIFQVSIERFAPAVVFDRLEHDIPKDDLIKILYWIALHPFDGTDSAVDELQPLGLGNGPGDQEQLRGRAAVYAVKLLGRLTGKRTGK